MGQRGPLRKPDSVRGRKEAARAQKLVALQADQKAKRRTSEPQSVAAIEAPRPVAAADAPKKPAWLTSAAGDIWQNLLDLLIAAEVPVKGIDTYALAMAAQSLAAVIYWGTPLEEAAAAEIDMEVLIGRAKLSQKCQIDTQSWLEKLGATPSSRLRMGIKPVVKKQEGAIAQLLAGRRKRAGPS